MNSVHYTFYQKPSAELPTIVGGVVGDKRAEDTRVVELTKLSSSAPTAFFDMTTQFQTQSSSKRLLNNSFE